ncbi:unnamed protein product, partial [Urochloa humidicola]
MRSELDLLSVRSTTPAAVSSKPEDRRRGFVDDRSGDACGGENTRGLYAWKKPPAATTRSFMPKFWSGPASGMSSNPGGIKRNLKLKLELKEVKMNMKVQNSVKKREKRSTLIFFHFCGSMHAHLSPCQEL